MNGSEIADWVAAIGQVAGAAGSFAAVAVALRLGLGEARRARADLADRDAAQGRLLRFAILQDGRQVLRTTNHSEGPFFDVTIEAVETGGADAAVVEEAGSPAVITVLEPGRTMDRFLDRTVDPESAVVISRFRDARGLRWRCAGTSTPTRLDG